MLTSKRIVWQFLRILRQSITKEEKQIQFGSRIKNYLRNKIFTLISWPEMNLMYHGHSICNDHVGSDHEPIYATSELLVKNLPRNNAELCQQMVNNYDHYQYLLNFTNTFFLLNPGIAERKVLALSLTTRDSGLAISFEGQFAYMDSRPQFQTTINGHYLREESGMLFYEQRHLIADSIKRVFTSQK